jgi:hypothetical protein
MKTKIITLLTDFGERDGYVAAMKGVILSACPQATILDAAHAIPAQDVEAAAWVLGQYWRLYPEGTVHVAVVDPTVGTQRAALLVEADRRWIIAPDNGLLTWVFEQAESCKVMAIKSDFQRPGGCSATFHGRDIFAYAAGMLAAGHVSLKDIAIPFADYVRGDMFRAQLVEGGISGRIIHVDHFGNLITNITERQVSSLVGSRCRIECGNCMFEELGRTYADVASGEPLVMIGSDGTIEIAVRDGSAANSLGLSRGDEVICSEVGSQ